MNLLQSPVCVIRLSPSSVSSCATNQPYVDPSPPGVKNLSELEHGTVPSFLGLPLSLLFFLTHIILYDHVRRCPLYIPVSSVPLVLAPSLNSSFQHIQEHLLARTPGQGGGGMATFSIFFCEKIHFSLRGEEMDMSEQMATFAISCDTTTLCSDVCSKYTPVP